MEDYVGDYTHPAYGPLEVRIVYGQVALLYAKRSISLSPSGDNLFLAKIAELQKFGVSPWIEISFSTNAERKTSEVQVPFKAFRSAKPVIFTRENKDF